MALSVILSPAVKVKVTKAGLVDKVLTSKVPDVARVAPVGILVTPYVPEWAYIFAVALPVGLPNLER